MEATGDYMHLCLLFQETLIEVKIWSYSKENETVIEVNSY